MNLFMYLIILKPNPNPNLLKPKVVNKICDAVPTGRSDCLLQKSMFMFVCSCI